MPQPVPAGSCPAGGLWWTPSSTRQSPSSRGRTAGTSEHDDTVRRSFEQQVGLFTGEESPFASRSRSSVGWLEPLDAGMIVLDVACGAGHVSEDVAPHVRQVVGVDLTPALLAVGSARMREKGIDNVLLQLGNGAELAFVDGSFDLVFCRSALHHFADPSAQVSEMARVCRPGGRVAVLDMVPPSREMRDSFDDVHRRIDPSHAAVLLEAEIAALLESAVGSVERVQPPSSTTIPLDIVLTELSHTDAVLSALRAELDGGAPTGLEPTLDGDRVLITARTTVMHATKRVRR